MAAASEEASRLGARLRSGVERGVAPTVTARQKGTVGSDDGAAADVLVEYVCLAKHRDDPVMRAYTLTSHKTLFAYCAHGADQGHEWIRVPATPADRITIGKMEDRPPQPRGRVSL